MDKSLGGDPALNFLRSQLLVLHKKPEAAYEAAKKAVDGAPDFKPGYLQLAHLAIEQKHYADAVGLLDPLSQKFHVDIEKLATEPGYDEFIQSPEYLEWKKTH